MTSAGRAGTLAGMATVIVHSVSAALVVLSHKTTVLHSGWFEITLANLIVFVLLLAVFALGLWIQLPGRVRRDGE
jgi:ethanolamine transporter EutH